jgi:hypothetical protein
MLKRILTMTLCIGLTSCSFCRVGPSNLVTDASQYNWAINQTTDSQLLLNIVRLRYGDNPTFLSVAVISSGYENKRSVGADLKLEQGDPIKWLLAPRGSRDYTEKPTTTFSVLSGQEFSKQMLSPLKLPVLALLNNVGWRIDRVMRTCIQRMNDVSNADTASGPTPTLAPEYKDFKELTDLFYKLEKERALYFFAEKVKGEDTPKFVLKIRKERGKPEELARLWELLDIDYGTEKMYLVPSHSEEHANNEILVDLRSPAGILYFLSHGVHVPQADQDRGIVRLTQDDNGYLFDWGQVMDDLMIIHSGPVDGESVFACTEYRGTHFFIRDQDITVKSTFSMLEQIIALQSGCPELPLLTLPVASP